MEDDTAARLIAEGRRGGAAEVAAIHSVIADVDIAGPGHRAAKNYPHDLDEAHAVLDGVGIDWSFVVATGGGLGAWAVLEEPLVVGCEEDRDEIQRLLGQFANGVDASAQRVGREVDHLADLPRVMRLAGTYNLKAGGKVPAVLVSWDAGVVLGDDDLAAACVADPPVSHPEAPARVPARRPLLEPKADGPNILAKTIDLLEWHEILKPHGWERREDSKVGGVTVERWRRPGASSFHSVVCWPGGGCKVHSDAVPGLPAGNYSKAEVVAHLAGITVSDLARELWQRGAASDYALPARALTLAAEARAEYVASNGNTAGGFPPAIDDAHMAVAFGQHLNGDFLYVAAWRRWLQWDGRRWADDNTEAIHERCRQWVLTLGSDMLAAGVDTDTVRRVAGYRSRAKLDAVVTLARRLDGISATVDEFDRDPDILNVGNGIVDLRTGELRPHDRAARCRKLADTEYRPDAHHADVDAVLAVVDDDVRPWLRRLFGYASTGHVSEDIVPVFDGTGANGKSTLLEAVGAVMGDYVGAAPAKLIMRTHNDEHPTIRADLLGRRLVWISETEEGGSLRMEQLKALTGGDRIKARFMRADYFEFNPTHTLVVATNHRPNVNSTEYAAWRRLRLVPFPHTYKSAGEACDGDRIKDARLRVRLTHSAQRSAMLAWIVAGAVEWHSEGLGEAATITAATDAWRGSEDVILRFAQECLVFDEGGTVRGRDLFNAYTEWCSSEGRPAKSNKNFAEAFLNHEIVRSAGVVRVRPQNQAHYRGVRIVGIAGV